MLKNFICPLDLINISTLCIFQDVLKQLVEDFLAPRVGIKTRDFYANNGCLISPGRHCL